MSNVTRLREACQIARSLRTRPDAWQHDPRGWLSQANLLIHRPTGWALWIGGGRRELQPFSPRENTPGGEWLHPSRYSALARLIIWYGGARGWYRHIERRPRARAQFRGEA